MNRRTVIRWAALAGFLASIPAANWWLDTYGFWDAPLLGPIPSGLWLVAISFCLRDLAQITVGRAWAWAAIAVGGLLSWWLASPAMAVASAVAFLLAEATDALIFTKLERRTGFVGAVLISGVVASPVDSIVFLRIAFGSADGWVALAIAKSIIVVAATPVAWLIRRWVR